MQVLPSSFLVVALFLWAFSVVSCCGPWFSVLGVAAVRVVWLILPGCLVAGRGFHPCPSQPAIFTSCATPVA